MSNKAHRKDRLKSWKAAEKARQQALFPLEDEILERFFEQMELAVARFGCRHDAQIAQDIIDSMQLQDQANALLDWCADHGGHCDCEIAGNAPQDWLENRAVTLGREAPEPR